MTRIESPVPFRPVETIAYDLRMEQRPDGSFLVQSNIPLEVHPVRMTERFCHWAEVSPDRIFLAQRDDHGTWRTLTYHDAYGQMLGIASWLLTRDLSEGRPLAIWSENSIEHALLALAALHIGLPYSPISPAYALRSKDFNKLRQVMDLLRPGMVLVSDPTRYDPALKAAANGLTVLASKTSPDHKGLLTLDQIAKTPVDPKVESAYQSIRKDTVAKILFTSGSSGNPKGVINTHGNITANWQQISQTFPFLKEEGLEYVDWLPWNHTFGGNHNFGLALYHGATLYIDDGKPTPEGIGRTVRNLTGRMPTVYFNVPKGFEELIPYLRNDETLRRQFFSNLKMLFYAGAGMPQHTWDALEELSIDTIGQKILIGTGLGCTETSPSALFASRPGGFAGLLGVPVPGLTLKLVPTGGKLEARYKGPNVFPAYWSQAELTRDAFDEEGFYRTGDALKFFIPGDPESGFLFDGRLTEDFKLSTGTWVHAAQLKARIIAAGAGLIQQVVLTGSDRPYIGAIVFVNPAEVKKMLKDEFDPLNYTKHPWLIARINSLLSGLNSESTGSSNRIERMILADMDLSLDRGEITDKGTINPAMIIRNHPELVDQIYG
ncbi:MAG TPA: feruloyl-CoA synthase [Saprospiraceae bacterium]|nr:feruloyl-CoA synthase [Saprospiraceae bacterium]HNT22376.1 feruloyl-CoA synthase [Saprospiraceae bacterium]